MDTDDIYTKLQYLADQAASQQLLSTARTMHADGLINPSTGRRFSGFDLMAAERLIAQLDALYKARWKRSALLFAALKNARAELERLPPNVIDVVRFKLQRKVNFLKILVAQVLEGTARPEVDADLDDSVPVFPALWARERLEQHMSAYRPECPYELCTGGTWRAVTREQLPDRVKWMEVR